MNTDQQAFPCPVAISPAGDEHIAYPGMSLRAFFAAKNCAAMVSTIRSDDDYQRLRDLAASHGHGLSEWIASESVKQADALIAILEAKS